MFVKGTEDKTSFKHDEGGLKVWGDNSPSSLCSDNTLSDVHFGRNLISGCSIKLTKDQIQDCGTLKKNIQDIQSSLIDNSALVAKTGDLNFTRGPDNFVSILFENVSQSEREASGENLFPACKVPAKMKLTFLTITINGRFIKHQ